MVEDRLPIPPPGFIPFHWKTRPYERDRSVAVEVCPVCDSFGSVWNGGGFTDPGAQAFYEKLYREGGDHITFDAFCSKYGGVMLKEHWSRYGTGKCTTCDVEFWHDFIGYPWHYYYNPATSKISHSYTPLLF